MVDSGIRPVEPATRAEKVDSKAEIADGAQPSDSIFALIGSKDIFKFVVSGGSVVRPWTGANELRLDG